MTDLSSLEIDVILAIDHVGWYAELWFPVVQREMMNFESNAPDEQVHAAVVGLVRRGVLREVAPHSTQTGMDVIVSEWRPDADSLAWAKARKRR